MELLQKHLIEEGHCADLFSTKASPWRRLLLPIKLRKTARHYEVLHIHCCSEWGFLPAVIGITIGRWMKKRIVLTYHGGGGDCFFQNHPHLIRHYLTRTDANIVLSGFLAKMFEKHQLPYTIIPNIIELDVSRFRQRETLKPNFICTRAHETIYNIPCILHAFQKVQTKIPEATLTLVGNGSEHEKIIILAQELNLRNVIFTGHINNSEIYQQLDHADIFLSSPTVDNMPVSILEAMNAGLLVISSRVGGIPFLIKNGCTGLLFDSDNDSELAEKMLWSIENQTIAGTIIQHAYHSVENYRWDYIREKILTAYGISS